MANCYPKQLKAEMGNGYSGCMMVDYPKQPWAEMGNGSEGDGGFHRGGSAPFPRQHGPRRLDQYLEIEPQRPGPPAIASLPASQARRGGQGHERAGVDVLEIQIHPFLETHIVSTGGNLPKAGKPGFHGKAPSLPVVIFSHLGRNRGPGSNDTHFTLKNIDQLRQLVHAGFPEEGSDLWNDTGVFSDFKDRSIWSLGFCFTQNSLGLKWVMDVRI
jgi:hypothetical protein